jgi:superfamily II DNA or RNA helicase
MIDPHITEELLRTCERLLPGMVLARGRQLFDRGAVLEIEEEEGGFSAFVQGSHPLPYGLFIESPTGQGAPRCECNCASFQRYGQACKHLYALALALEAGMIPTAAVPDWERRLAELDRKQGFSVPPKPASAAMSRKSTPSALRLLIPLDAIKYGGFISLRPLALGETAGGKPRVKSLTLGKALEADWNPEDARLMDQVLALHLRACGTYFDRYTEGFRLPEKRLHELLPALLDTGKIWVMPLATAGREPDPTPLGNRMEENWGFEMSGSEEDGDLVLSGILRWQDRVESLAAPALLHDQGLIFWENGLSRLANPEQFPWISSLRSIGSIRVPKADIPAFLTRWYQTRSIPPLDLPESVALHRERVVPVPRLEFRKSEAMPEDVIAQLTFLYGTLSADWDHPSDVLADVDKDLAIPRDWPAEKEALRLLAELGGDYRPADWQEDVAGWHFDARDWTRIVTTLAPLDWVLLWRGKRLRKSGGFQYEISSSGVDWFDVQGKLHFGDHAVELPALLKSIARGEQLIELGNGEQGLIPEELREQLGLLARMGDGKANEGALRFQGAQTVMLDLMLADMPEVNWDRLALGLRDNLRTLGAPRPAKPPASFVGTLRPYQEEGLGWMRHLRELGIQGCLADDMGLGKTVQVLAMLEERRLAGAPASIAVVPKSLAYNWQAEAARFTPALRVAALAGTGRPKNAGELPPADLYITTYAVLLRDIAWLKDLSFDYAILDESQAIKNAGTQSAKACRLLRATHRLTMTGTPVENRLDDLWSQLDFLNPGLLGAGKWQGRDLEPETLARISRSVQPFLLRRTKELVAKDLPEKVEETLYCEMPPAQKKHYQELQEYYRAHLGKTIGAKGLNKSKILVLEALLRLRQAACHPGLLSNEFARVESGKFTALQILLDEILASGHKALVFSQFTSLLSLLRAQLDKQGVAYAYLDGSSTDRPAQIQRFQEDAACPLFLISLKAGGVGLNLTAADYVILLDPWWNPAVEAQAIDRAHRIGQTKKVFAYRIVSRGTIEDKILQLQDKKRDLADAILTEQNSVPSSLTPDDLAFLLG